MNRHFQAIFWAVSAALALIQSQFSDGHASLWLLASLLCGASAGIEWFRNQRSPVGKATTTLWQYLQSEDWREAVVLFESATSVLLLCGLQDYLSVTAISVLAPFSVAPWLVERKNLSEDGARTGFLSAGIFFLASYTVAKGWIPPLEGILGTLTAIGVVIFHEQNRVQVELNETALQTVYTGKLAVPAEDAEESEAKVQELRENFRKLRDSYQDLQRQKRADQLMATLLEWKLSGNPSLHDLSNRIRQELEVEGMSIYLVPESKDRFTLSGTSGTAPLTAFLDTPVNASPILIREKSALALKAIRSETARNFVNVLLLDRGRLIGLAVLFDNQDERLEAVESFFSAHAPVVAHLIREEKDNQVLESRLKQAELMLKVSGNTTGSGAQAAQSLCTDLCEALDLQGCVVVDLVGNEPQSLGQVGIAPFDLLNFNGLPGLKGWIESGAQETVIADARNDFRTEKNLALRRGVGSVIVIPLQSSGQLVGALAAWTEKAQGLTAISMNSLRDMVSTVVNRVFGGFSTVKAGLVDARTFQTRSQGPGTFCTIDLGRAEGELATAELTKARRQVLAAAISRLPDGGMLTRRPNGHLGVFLAGLDEERAELWNEGLRPLCEEKWGMQVFLAETHQQTHQFLPRMAA